MIRVCLIGQIQTHKARYCRVGVGLQGRYKNTKHAIAGSGYGSYRPDTVWVLYKPYIQTHQSRYCRIDVGLYANTNAPISRFGVGLICQVQTHKSRYCRVGVGLISQLYKHKSRYCRVGVDLISQLYKHKSRYCRVGVDLISQLYKHINHAIAGSVCRVL